MSQEAKHFVWFVNLKICTTT